MKKKALCSIALALLCWGTIGSTVQAADPTTKGKVQFEVDENGTTGPLNPGNPDPEKPIEPEVPGESTSGALRLDHISHIDFGKKNKITSKQQSYYALFEKGKDSTGSVIEYPSYFQLTDDRGGTLGWKVSVKNDGVFKNSDGSKKFEKAILSFSDIQAKGATAQDVAAYPTVASGEVEIKDNLAKELASAKSASKQGNGTWIFTIGDISKKTSGQGTDGNDTSDPSAPVDVDKKDKNPAVKLNIAKGTILEANVEYSTNLVWEIADSY